MQNQTTPPTAPLLPDLTTARRRFSRVGWAMVIYTLIPTLIAYAIYFAVLKFAPYLITKDWFYWVYAVAPMYVIGLPLFIFALKGVPAEAPESKKLGFKSWVILLLMSVSILYAGNITGNLLMTFVSLSTGKEFTNPVSEMLSGASFWINAAIVAVIGPIIEEIIFRKLIIDRTRIWGEKTAIVFSALLFGLSHGNFYQFFYAFGLGMFFAYIYIRTGRLRHTIALHIFINSFFGVFANWVISKIPMEFLEKLMDPEYFESVMASEEAMTEFMNTMLLNLPALLLYGFYTFALMFMALCGLVFFIVYRKRLYLKKTECELPRGYICAPVYGAVGVMVAITLGILLIAISLIG